MCFFLWFLVKIIWGTVNLLNIQKKYTDSFIKAIGKFYIYNVFEWPLIKICFLLNSKQIMWENRLLLLLKKKQHYKKDKDERQLWSSWHMMLEILGIESTQLLWNLKLCYSQTHCGGVEKFFFFFLFQREKKGNSLDRRQIWKRDQVSLCWNPPNKNVKSQTLKVSEFNLE